MKVNREPRKAENPGRASAVNLRQSIDRLDRGEAVSKSGNWELHLTKGAMVAPKARVPYTILKAKNGVLKT